jgi:hypothetical protein
MNASGEPYLMISFPIKRCMTIFVDGSKQGLWQQINQSLLKQVRISQGRHEELTLAIVDSRSVKGTSKGGTKAALSKWAASS